MTQLVTNYPIPLEQVGDLIKQKFGSMGAFAIKVASKTEPVRLRTVQKARDQTMTFQDLLKISAVLGRRLMFKVKGELLPVEKLGAVIGVEHVWKSKTVDMLYLHGVEGIELW